MKVKAKVLQTLVSYEKGLLAKLQFNGKLPKQGDWVTVSWGAKRSNLQNALYWAYLTWLIDHGGLKDHGHFSPEALHENLKSHFLSEKIFDKGEFKSIEETSTTDLDKEEFGLYLDKVNEFMKDFFEIDTQPFWDEQGQR